MQFFNVIGFKSKERHVFFTKKHVFGSRYSSFLRSSDLKVVKDNNSHQVKD